jgi:hypothetical protein
MRIDSVLYVIIYWLKSLKPKGKKMKKCSKCGYKYEDWEMSFGDNEECRDCYLSSIDGVYMTD